MKKEKKKWNRLIKGGIFFCSLGFCVFFILLAFERSLIFFYTPTQLQEMLSKKNTLSPKIRLGGLVQRGSFSASLTEKKFILKDDKAHIQVHYQGVLPNLFREGQGIVAEGTWDPIKQVFQAQRVLAKHDEVYIARKKNALNRKEDSTIWRPALH